MVIYKKDLLVGISILVAMFMGVLAYLFFATHTFTRTGKLSVAATPDITGLSVYINGEKTGVIERWQSKKHGMFTVELPVGQHTVQLKMQSDGYQITSKKHTANVGSEQTYLELPVKYELEKRSKTLIKIAQRFRSLPKRPNDFTLHADGTVSDKRTGLQWAACSVGQTWVENTCQGEPTELTWAAAKEVAATYAQAGHNDWRFPTIFELQTLVYCSSHKDGGIDDYGKFNGCENNYDDNRDKNTDWEYQSPTIVKTAFPNAGGTKPYPGYWSSSRYFNKIDSVYFLHGLSVRYSPEQTYLLRLVRTPKKP